MGGHFKLTAFLAAPLLLWALRARSSRSHDRLEDEAERYPQPECSSCACATQLVPESLWKRWREDVDIDPAAMNRWLAEASGSADAKKFFPVFGFLEGVGIPEDGMATGEGANGKVYILRLTDGGRVAVKGVRLQAPPAEQVSHQWWAKHRLREPFMEAGLGIVHTCPQVMKSYGFWYAREDRVVVTVSEALDYSVEDYVGHEIKELSAPGLMSFSTGLAIVGQVLKGLAYLHTFGLVHGDIKPGNTMLKALRATDGRLTGFHVKIIDLGSTSCNCEEKPSCRVLATCTSEGFGGITSEYMHPLTFTEDVGDMVLDYRDDVYASGMILWESIITLMDLKLFTTDTDYDEDDELPRPCWHPANEYMDHEYFAPQMVNTFGTFADVKKEFPFEDWQEGKMWEQMSKMGIPEDGIQCILNLLRFLLWVKVDVGQQQRAGVAAKMAEGCLTHLKAPAVEIVEDPHSIADAYEAKASLLVASPHRCQPQGSNKVFWVSGGPDDVPAGFAKEPKGFAPLHEGESRSENLPIMVAETSPQPMPWLSWQLIGIPSPRSPQLPAIEKSAENLQCKSRPDKTACRP